MKKLMVITSILLALVLALAGCAPAADNAETATDNAESAADNAENPASEAATEESGSVEQLSFTLVLPMGANEVWNACAEGFEEACKSIGAEAVVVSPSKPNDVNEMNALVETAIASQTDGVITQAVNPEGQAPVFAKLDEAGIPYCLVNSDAVESNRLAFIGTGDELGIVGGKAIVEAMEGEEIVFATALFNTTAPIAISLHEAYLSELEKNEGGFSEAVIIDTKSDQLTSVQEWTNALMTYPKINAGMNICGFGGLGAARAMKELGYEPGEIIMIAIDDVPETMDGIREGYLYGTMTQNFFRMGYEPVIWMQDFIKEDKTPEQVVNDSGTMLVTMDNIDTYKEDMRDPSKW